MKISIGKVANYFLGICSSDSSKRQIKNPKTEKNGTIEISRAGAI
jgi:hypothetical protein